MVWSAQFKLDNSADNGKVVLTLTQPTSIADLVTDVNIQVTSPTGVSAYSLVQAAYLTHSQQTRTVSFDIPKDLYGAYQKGQYRFNVQFARHDVAAVGPFPQIINDQLFDFCPLVKPGSFSSDKFLHEATYACKGAIVKSQDATDYTDWSGIARTHTLEPPAVSDNTTVTSTGLTISLPLDWEMAKFNASLEVFGVNQSVSGSTTQSYANTWTVSSRTRLVSQKVVEPVCTFDSCGLAKCLEDAASEAACGTGDTRELRTATAYAAAAFGYASCGEPEKAIAAYKKAALALNCDCGCSSTTLTPKKYP